MTIKEIKAIFDKIKKIKVLVIGDVMVDSYIFGRVERISPEAPVPILSVSRREERLGGAANVALNIKSLSAEPILCSIIGNDQRGKTFIKLLKENNLTEKYIYICNDRPTTTKFRIISQNQHHLLRVDEEVDFPLPSNERKNFKKLIFTAIKQEKPDVIVFQDYDKGSITPDLIKEITELSLKNSIPVAVDPKKRNFSEYKNVTLFKPNLKELKEGLKIDNISSEKESLKKAIVFLEKLINPQICLITLSEKGIFYSYKKDGRHYTDIIPSKVRQISDVSGAGDTVISCAATLLPQNIGIIELATISNIAGGIVCEYPGVVPIDRNRLINETIEWFSKNKQ